MLERSPSWRSVIDIMPNEDHPVGLLSLPRGDLGEIGNFVGVWNVGAFASTIESPSIWSSLMVMKMEVVILLQ